MTEKEAVLIFTDSPVVFFLDASHPVCIRGRVVALEALLCPATLSSMTAEPIYSPTVYPA